MKKLLAKPCTYLLLRRHTVCERRVDSIRLTSNIGPSGQHIHTVIYYLSQGHYVFVVVGLSG